VRLDTIASISVNRSRRLAAAAKVLGALWCFSVLPAAASTSSEPDRPRYALIIGNANYDAAPALKNPLNDARDMCRTLQGLKFKTFCYYNVKSRLQMRALIEDYSEALGSGAVNFIYYAGHAVQVGGENYLIPTGAQLHSEQSLVGESVGVSYIMRELRRNQDYLNVIILDACRDNPLSSHGTSATEGLAPVTDVPDATEVLYATAADATALDGQGRNGIMTKYLLAGVHMPGTIDDLFRTVSVGVQEDTQALGYPQKPALYTNFGGQYCLERCTDLEMLQMDRELAEQRVRDIQARVAAGDERAASELSKAKSDNAKLADLIRKKEEEAKKAKDRENKSFVPPAF